MKALQVFAGLTLRTHLRERGLAPADVGADCIMLNRPHTPGTAALSNVVLLTPSDEWLRTLPGGRLPDRGDFKAWGGDEAGRQGVWRKALAQSQDPAAEFAVRVSSGRGIDALPLV